LPEDDSEGGTALAIFDFDGTVCRLNSWQVLVRWLLRTGGLTTVRVGLGLAGRAGRVVDRPKLKRIALAHLDGWSRSEVTALGQQLYERQLGPALIPGALDELRRRREAGFRVVIATGAFEFLIRPFCADYGVRDLVAAPLEWSGDRCRGYASRVEVEGIEKLRRVETLLTGEQVSWTASVAYSDDLVDTPVLTRVGCGFLVGGGLPRSAELPPGVLHGTW
jgi:HAD superfamily phosphoserine phosphatase-like hydrolase